jgi:hypothetical protein
MSNSTTIFSHVLVTNNEDFSQWRLVVNEFRGVQYFQIRRYFLSFEGTWEPTKEGFSVPLSLAFTYNLIVGLSVLMSESEIDSLGPDMVQLLKNNKEVMKSELLNLVYEIVEDEQE